MQAHGSVPSRAINSSAEANPRAPYPSEESDSTSATRNNSSSSMTAINGCLDTYHPFPGPGMGFSLHKRRQRNYTAVLLLPCLWLLGFDHLGHPHEVS